VFFEEMIYFEIQDCDMPKHCMDHILYLKYRLLILLPYHFNPTFPEVREYPESPYILSNVAKKLRVFHAPVSKVYHMWGQRGRLCTLDQLHTRTETDFEEVLKCWNFTQRKKVILPHHSLRLAITWEAHCSHKTYQCIDDPFCD
jgi:hypothetical protein